MKKIGLALLLALIASLGLARRASAGDTPASGSGVLADTQPADLLGATFESESAGISLRVPSGFSQIASSNAGDDIAQFGDPQRKWQLKLTRIVRLQSTELDNSVDNFGKTVPGLLETTVVNLKRDLSGCTILRQDVSNIADGGADATKARNNVGLIAVRYTVGGTTFLSQQAIIRFGERLFYLMSLTSPAAQPAGEDAPPDPQERAAVETFRQMLDSVRLLDTAAIRREQDERLLRTRGRLVQMKSKSLLRAVLVGERWLRILRNGHDVGYSYVTEQTAAGVPRPLTRKELSEGKSDSDLVKPGDGILIGIRSRILNPPDAPQENGGIKGPVQIDNATWQFVTPDQNLEDWSRITVVSEGAADKDSKPVQRQTTEFGSSNIQTRSELDRDLLPGTKIDLHQPPVSIREHHNLNVTFVSDTGATNTLDQEVPKFYLPQALGHLLPRLLPMQPEADGSPRTYMFATYVPENRQIMSRYVDVGIAGDFNLAGSRIHATPVSDRLGWHGSITIHYMGPDGRYLGSENKDTHTVILPSDAATLLSIWKGADLTPPAAPQRPGRGGSSPTTSPVRP